MLLKRNNHHEEITANCPTATTRQVPDTCLRCPHAHPYIIPMMTSDQYLTQCLASDNDIYTGYYLQAIVLGYSSTLNGTLNDATVRGKYPRLGEAFVLGSGWAHQFKLSLTTKAR